MLDLGALSNCFSNSACLVTQSATGVIIGMLLFLVASGVTLIFGVLHVVNFAHGAFYMIGAYVAYSTYGVTGNYYVAVLVGTIAAAIVGVLFERSAISRVYKENLLMQLLVCYAFVLICDDAVKIIWGSEYLAMGVPDEFRVRPWRIAGGVVPPFYLFLAGTALMVAVLSLILIRYSRFGKIVRAAAANPTMVSVLGIRVPIYFATLFGLGCGLAGMAGALAAPVRSLTPGMGLSILIESFIVTVIGGMGSIPGALLAALLLGFTRAFGSLGFPLFVDGAMFLMMVVILVFRPQGLLGERAGR
ncbi:amino acid/amide ABC transporter membrane protein 1, HAAT family [Thalassovita litoralis]|jgi:branched-chain amino acid transport system permease protein|uniref:Amino acid/amide ABC transporter membrane protein 1, HAAT family n=1 Tax=Thalassovita litoralis TaxID=1010611 RepID=A0A521BMD2_9RHOB|nr:branched-chain amino acid ABC transporter permease [Thalassovita litoralis]SMO48252.1 amino acid/amide ABC transporter membrane protein 1, HAAT family [Thalassovita litoralis]